MRTSAARMSRFHTRDQRLTGGDRSGSPLAVSEYFEGSRAGRICDPTAAVEFDASPPDRVGWRPFEEVHRGAHLRGAEEEDGRRTTRAREQSAARGGPGLHPVEQRPSAARAVQG